MFWDFNGGQLLDGDITPFPPGTKHVCQFIQAVREQDCAGRPCEALWPSYQGFHDKCLWNSGTKLEDSLFPGSQRTVGAGSPAICRSSWRNLKSSSLKTNESTLYHNSQEAWTSGTSAKLQPRKTKVVSQVKSPLPQAVVGSHVSCSGQEQDCLFSPQWKLENWKILGGKASKTQIK